MRRPSSLPCVLVIIVCYNGIKDTLACLESLSHVQGVQLDTIIVDNGSADQTPAHVRMRFPMVTVIEAGENLGFAGGNNRGLRYALQQGYDYVLLLNNDTEVSPDFLRLMVQTAETDPTIGVVGPTITYHERRDLVWSAGGSIDWKRGNATMEGGKPPAHYQAGGVRDVDFVTGCALLCRRDVLERAGLLDERFFMYYEETEWCVRIARAGYRIVYQPDALVFHKIPLNARSDKEYLAYYMTRNRLLFLRATSAPLVTWLHALVLQDLRTFVSLVMRAKWRKRAGRVGMQMAWRDYWRGRFGMMPQQ